MSDVRVLILPGWLNSDDAHWQSRWERLHGYRRVEQDDWLWPRRGDWMARLDEVILESDTPAVLVAHSLGTQLTAAWAAHSRHAGRVRCALLVAIPDVEHPDAPPQLSGWRPIVRQRLPFPATAVLSTNDPFGAIERTAAMAADWGAAVESIGPCGHINGESGLGDWPEGHALLQGLMADN
jgi:predicted alpha/beta hydrolase family esterase